MNEFNLNEIFGNQNQRIFTLFTAGHLDRCLTKTPFRGHIQRHVAGDTVFVPDHVARRSVDHLLPCRITDLRAALSLKFRSTVALTWTAAGDDVDHGKGNTKIEWHTV